MTAHTQDDAFHEIQLNGKQLVFLFMAATVVSVVIFLCGVLVGRGVREERGGTVADAAAGTAPELPARQAAVAPPAGSDPTTAAPPPAADDLSYSNRLEKSGPAAEELKPAPGPRSGPGSGATAGAAAAPGSGAGSDRVPPPAAAKGPSPEKKGPSPEKSPEKIAPAAAASDEESASTTRSAVQSAPTGPGFAVQVAALNVKGEADAIARRLSSRGYAAYVLDPATGTPQVYRVRVGKFGSRHEADTVAAKLQKEEQFKPWVTR